MFKNLIIIILILMLCSVLGNNKGNVDILVEDITDVKAGVTAGTIYLKQTFENTFGEHFVDKVKDEAQKTFPENLNMKSPLKENPFSEGLMTGTIQEETFSAEDWAEAGHPDGKITNEYEEGSR
jgi:hypothetical protein